MVPLEAQAMELQAQVDEITDRVLVHKVGRFLAVFDTGPKDGAFLALGDYHAISNWVAGFKDGVRIIKEGNKHA